MPRAGVRGSWGSGMVNDGSLTFALCQGHFASKPARTDWPVATGIGVREASIQRVDLVAADIAQGEASSGLSSVQLPSFPR